MTGLPPYKESTKAGQRKQIWINATTKTPPPIVVRGYDSGDLFRKASLPGFEQQSARKEKTKRLLAKFCVKATPFVTFVGEKCFNSIETSPFTTIGILTQMDE
jgi:hypothetical protein